MVGMLILGGIAILILVGVLVLPARGDVRASDRAPMRRPLERSGSSLDEGTVLTAPTVSSFSDGASSCSSDSSSSSSSDSC